MCVDGCVDGGAGIRKNPLDSVGKQPNWVHEWIIVVVVWYCLIFLVVLLINKGPRDTFCICQVGVCILELSVIGEEVDVSDACEFRLLMCWCFYVFI